MQNIIFRPDTRAWLQWLFAFNASLSLAGNSGRLTRERQTVARAALPTVTSECGVFSCVSINNNVANFFFFFFFNTRTDVDACDCTLGLYGHRKRVCTEN